MPSALTRAIAGALRDAIADHGPITPELIGSAAKRIVAGVMAALGSRGGSAGTGDSKRRSPEHYRRLVEMRAERNRS